MAFKDPEVRKEYLRIYMQKNRRRYKHKHGYDCSAEQYNKMFQEQEGCCAICGAHQSESKRQLAVDHNHETGKVRALLWMTCNTQLGIYEKYKETFKNYLLEKDSL